MIIDYVKKRDSNSLLGAYHAKQQIAYQTGQLQEGQRTATTPITYQKTPVMGCTAKEDQYRAAKNLVHPYLQGTSLKPLAPFRSAPLSMFLLLQNVGLLATGH